MYSGNHWADEYERSQERVTPYTEPCRYNHGMHVWHDVKIASYVVRECLLCKKKEHECV